MGCMNLVNNASWKHTDLLFATPAMIKHILEKRESFDPFGINPKVIVFDEFDMLM